MSAKQCSRYISVLTGLSYGALQCLGLATEAINLVRREAKPTLKPSHVLKWRSLHILRIILQKSSICWCKL